MPILAGITIYPFKSLGPAPVAQARITEGGGLEHDREFAFVDSEGKYINGKRTPKIHLLCASLDRKDGALWLQTRDGSRHGVFSLPREQAGAEAWLSDFFGLPTFLRRNAAGGFPDDTNAPGPTLISAATLEQVGSWYDGLQLNELRARFRANLEIADAPPFWEDRLFGSAEETVRFQIGAVTLEGTNPCQRCIVPTRDTRTGEPTPEFSQTFRARREATLPPWANAARFNHFYRLAVNTRVPASETGKSLRLGDEVRLLR